MDSKELLDSALNARDRLLTMFMTERYVYLVLTAVSFLLLLYAGYLLVTTNAVSTEVLVAVFGCSGLATSSSSRITRFFNRASSLLEASITRIATVQTPRRHVRSTPSP